MKVFFMGDIDWVAAETKEDAIKYYTDIGDPLDPDEVVEMTDSRMSQMLHFGPEENQYNPPITFAEELRRNIAEGIEFPCIFASTSD